MTDAPGLATLERLLAAVTRQLQERDTLGEIAQRCGHHLPPASWSLLEHLEALGRLRVSQVAACHGVDVSSVTPRLQALEVAGLVSRERDASDGRVHLIAITAEGSAALNRLHEVRAELLADVLGDVPAADLAATNAVLDRLVRGLGEAAPIPVGSADADGAPRDLAAPRGRGGALRL